MPDEPETTTEQEQGADGTHVQHAERWLNNHGQPSFDYMMKTAEKGTAEAVETIAEWAQSHDLDFDPTVPLQEMVQRIWLAMESNSNMQTS